MTYRNLLAEALASHADQLTHSDETSASLTTDDDRLPPLFNLADHVKHALEPVAPSDKFREQLERDLMAAAYLRQEDPPPRVRISHVVPAFIALGGIFFLIRRQQKTQTLKKSSLNTQEL